MTNPKLFLNPGSSPSFRITGFFDAVNYSKPKFSPIFNAESLPLNSRIFRKFLSCAGVNVAWRLESSISCNSCFFPILRVRKSNSPSICYALFMSCKSGEASPSPEITSISPQLPIGKMEHRVLFYRHTHQVFWFVCSASVGRDYVVSMCYLHSLLLSFQRICKLSRPSTLDPDSLLWCENDRVGLRRSLIRASQTRPSLSGHELL